MITRKEGRKEEISTVTEPNSLGPWDQGALKLDTDISMQVVQGLVCVRG